jgi:hypothetical protein
MLKYVSVELIRRKDIDGNTLTEPEVLRGFFKGIKVALDEKTQQTTEHIIIEVDNKEVRMLNLKHFYVLSLERADSKRRWISYPKTSKFDQETVFEALAKILAEFQDEGWCTADPDIINTAKYKDIPKRLLSQERKPAAAKKTAPKAKSTALVPVGQGAAKSAVGTPGIPPIGTVQRHVPRVDVPVGTGGGTTHHTTYKAPAKPSPLFFKRKTRRPTQRAMETMWEKVVATQDEDFEANLPVVPGEFDELPDTAFEHKSAKWNTYGAYGSMY